MCLPSVKKYHPSQCERNKICEMKRNGMSYDEIADAMESRWPKLDKEKRRRKIRGIINNINTNPKWTDEEEKLLIYCYNKDECISTSCLQLFFPTKTYSQIRNKRDILRRKGIIGYHCAAKQREANKLAVIEGKDEAKAKDSFNYIDENYFSTFEICSDDDVK